MLEAAIRDAIESSRAGPRCELNFSSPPLVLAIGNTISLRASVAVQSTIS